jgi:hypothetical protein
VQAFQLIKRLTIDFKALQSVSQLSTAKSKFILIPGTSEISGFFGMQIHAA